MIFQFKQFTVDQTGCAMKINTDGVLLGALAYAEDVKNILDIGTGTGVIALMLAQRFPGSNIDAVEIDERAAATAQANFNNSAFNERLAVYAQSFQDYFRDYPGRKYDMIVANPPFYINSLASAGKAKSVAKHASEDFFLQLINAASRHLTGTGQLALILPLNTATVVKQMAFAAGLFINGITNIASYPESAPHRQLLVFGLKSAAIANHTFIIYDSAKIYSVQYSMALSSFFTIF